MIKDEHTSNDSLQSDSSFLLRNNTMTNTSSSLIIEIQLLHAVYIGSSHCIVRLIICSTVLEFSAIMYYY